MLASEWKRVGVEGFTSCQEELRREMNKYSVCATKNKKGERKKKDWRELKRKSIKTCTN